MTLEQDPLETHHFLHPDRKEFQSDCLLLTAERVLYMSRLLSWFLNLSIQWCGAQLLPPFKVRHLNDHSGFHNYSLHLTKHSLSCRANSSATSDTPWWTYQSNSHLSFMFQNCETELLGNKNHCERNQGMKSCNNSLASASHLPYKIVPFL